MCAKGKKCILLSSDIEGFTLPMLATYMKTCSPLFRPMQIFLLWFAILFGSIAQAAVLKGTHGNIHYEFASPTPRCEGRPTTILVHGFSTPMWAWDPLFQALQNRGCGVLRFDLHGRGESDAAAVDTLSTFHDQINDLRQALNIDGQFNLVGWSMGGAIVVSYATLHPTQTSRVALIAPFSQPKDIPLIQSSLWDFLVVDLLSQFHMGWGYEHNLANPDQFFQLHPEYRSLFEAIVLTPKMARSLLSSARNIISVDQTEHYRKLSQLGIPVQIVWGRQDQVLPYEESAILLKAMPKAQMVTINNAGHGPQLEAPAEVLPAMFNFLLPDIK